MYDNTMVRIGEMHYLHYFGLLMAILRVHYEANTSTIGWKEADVCWRNNWLFPSYGGSIYYVMYFANWDTPLNVRLFIVRLKESSVSVSIKVFTE